MTSAMPVTTTNSPLENQGTIFDAQPFDVCSMQDWDAWVHLPAHAESAERSTNLKKMINNPSLGEFANESIMTSPQSLGLHGTWPLDDASWASPPLMPPLPTPESSHHGQADYVSLLPMGTKSGSSKGARRKEQNRFAYGALSAPSLLMPSNN